MVDLSYNDSSFLDTAKPLPSGGDGRTARYLNAIKLCISVIAFETGIFVSGLFEQPKPLQAQRVYRQARQAQPAFKRPQGRGFVHARTAKPTQAPIKAAPRAITQRVPVTPLWKKAQREILNHHAPRKQKILPHPIAQASRSTPPKTSAQSKTKTKETAPINWQRVTATSLIIGTLISGGMIGGITGVSGVAIAHWLKAKMVTQVAYVPAQTTTLYASATTTANAMAIPNPLPPPLTRDDAIIQEQAVKTANHALPPDAQDSRIR